MAAFKAFFNAPWARRPLFRYGLPFMATVIGGSFWLRDFAQLRYTFRQNRQATVDELEKYLGVPMKRDKINVQKELETVQNEVQDEYMMIRGPREYEDSTETRNTLNAIVEKRQAERARRRDERRRAATNPAPATA